jgi:Leucine-rich repeat (LRR) protein
VFGWFFLRSFVLDLGHNRIAALPDELFDMVSLRGLFLQNNALLRVSPKISQLSSLQELYLSSNQLSCVPASIVHLEHLDCLWLDGNDCLPGDIALNISRNRGLS